MTPEEIETGAREMWAAASGSAYGVGNPMNYGSSRHPSAVAYAFVYAITGDRATAKKVVDRITAQYIRDNLTVSTLPRTVPETVVVNGEVLQRPVKHYTHGEYRWVEDEQAWYMACESGYGRSFSWNKQSPEGSGWEWRDAADQIDKLRELTKGSAR